VLAVTVADPNATNKSNRFVGICIYRGDVGLRHQFILRNVVDHQGVEILYDMYCPLIQKIEVLKLEKRVDATLFYLRDALPEYSTFQFHMEPEVRAEGAPVPINAMKVFK
jgi:large subunit ribosomal protein L19